MRVFKFKDKSKLVTINEWKYKIDWENDGASKIEIKFRNLIFPYWKNSIIFPFFSRVSRINKIVLLLDVLLNIPFFGILFA